MKYSIIIPTYNKCDELLKPCIESILKYTDIGEETEIIVAANGCVDNTVEYVESLHAIYPTIRLLEWTHAIGFTKAVNNAMNVAHGEYFIILNNDTILLDQPKNQWLEILNKPFITKGGKPVGITGPMKVPNDSTGLPFLIFFCVMIDRSCYLEIGLMDEIFSPGYGEDTDFCLRAESFGYDCIQVPEHSELYYADKRMTGNFPIYHAGNQTFKDYPDADLIHRNNAIIKERWGTATEKLHKLQTEVPAWEGRFREKYGTPGLKIAPLEGFEFSPQSIDVSRALKCDGYMALEELVWLAQQAKTHKFIIEVGSWHGKSSRALADNLMLNGRLICVDHWKGSFVERESNHASALGEDGDAAYLEFLGNMADLPLDKVYPLRLSSRNAAKFLSERPGIKADMIFIDAGHIYEEVKADILAWLPLLNEGGMMCGHDMFHVNNVWPGVGQAVNEIFGLNVKQAPNTSIWMVDNWKHETYHSITIDLSEPKPKRPPCVYDCFPYNNEVDVLVERFETLYNTVDRFIIVEARVTHGGKLKELTFEKNMDKFAKYVNKVTYLAINEFPEVQGSPTDKSWARERFQRDFIKNGITDCQDDDIIIISDCDEIPSAQSVDFFRDNLSQNNLVVGLEMNLFYYNKHVMAKDKWNEARITTYNKVKELSPCGVRYYKPDHTISNAGNHLSYFGGVEAIAQKIEDTAHQEYNTDHYKNRMRILRAMREGKDVFDRPDVKFTRV